MAKEDEKKPTAAEKGKGKAPVNGDADKDAKTGKDGKVDAEDKKGVATATGMFACGTAATACNREWKLTVSCRGAQRGGPTAQERTGHASRADTGKPLPRGTSLVSPRLALTFDAIGIRHQPVQARARPDQGLHQDVDEFDDGSAQAAQVPPTALREPGEGICIMARGREQGRWRRQTSGEDKTDSSSNPSLTCFPSWV
jgi:hypothetical protein